MTLLLPVTNYGQSTRVNARWYPLSIDPDASSGRYDYDACPSCFTFALQVIVRRTIPPLRTLSILVILVNDVRGGVILKPQHIPPGDLQTLETHWEKKGGEPVNIPLIAKT